MKVKSFSRVRLLAYQAPPSMEFSRQEYWSEVLLPSPLIQDRVIQLRNICLVPIISKKKLKMLKVDAEGKNGRFLGFVCVCVYASWRKVMI